MIRDFFTLIFHNFWYKLAAILLAVLVWSIVQAEEIVELNKRIKVNISVANGYAVKGDAFRFVDATLKGPRFLLSEMASEALEAKVYVDSGQVGSLEIPFNKRDIANWDNRIKLTVRDAFISVFVDEVQTRTLPVREVLQGAPAEGYFVEKVILDPQRVEITGLKSDLAKIDELVTEPIDVADLKQSKSYEAAVILPNPNTSTASSELIKVILQIGDSKINKRFRLIPVDIVGSEYKASVRPKFVNIVIQGTPGVLSFVNKSDLRAFVEVSTMTPGSYEREIQVKIPPDTVLIETFPQKGTIKILDEKRTD